MQHIESKVTVPECENFRKPARKIEQLTKVFQNDARKIPLRQMRLSLCKLKKTT